jgi:uncharacterized protein YqjF (DUF2071 family)
MKVFLDAEWRKLVMANYVVNPEILNKYLPPNTTLDLWEGKCFVSLIGFMFLNTRLKGFRVPFHVSFEEVNLRFYVIREVDGELRRGVVFIREIVPKRILSFVANQLYKEHYATMPMQHEWKAFDDHIQVTYKWKKNAWHSISVTSLNTTLPIQPNSEEEFITEHYWGFTKLSENKTLEYRVEHPRWEILPVVSFAIEVDFKTLYGGDFTFLNHQSPHSVFLAEGSEIQVYNYRNVF